MVKVMKRPQLNCNKLITKFNGDTAENLAHPYIKNIINVVRSLKMKIGEYQKCKKGGFGEVEGDIGKDSTSKG